MIVSLIAAMDKNRVIGKDNDLPWRIPRDWNYVLDTTFGHPIILGRRNFESMDEALPDRRNIVLTRNTSYSAQGCEVVHSVEEAFKSCKNEDEIFIFGGEQIYRLFLPYVEKMYITKIDYAFEGDTYFPEIDYDEWVETSVYKGIVDIENPYDYYFHTYIRRAR